MELLDCVGDEIKDSVEDEVIEDDPKGMSLSFIVWSYGISIDN